MDTIDMHAIIGLAILLGYAVAFAAVLLYRQSLASLRHRTGAYTLESIHTGYAKRWRLVDAAGRVHWQSNAPGSTLLQ